MRASDAQVRWAMTMPADDQRAADGDRHGDVLAEHDRGEHETRDRLQELQRRDPGDAAAVERPVPADVAEDRRHEREEDDSAPRGRTGMRHAVRRRGARARAARARRCRAARPRRSSRGSRARAAAASRLPRIPRRRTAPRRARAGRRRASHRWPRRRGRRSARPHRASATAHPASHARRGTRRATSAA